MKEPSRGAFSTAGRLLASLLCGIVVCRFVDWDVQMLALAASLYTLGEASFLQARQRKGRDLAALGNLPLHDARVFDAIIADTARHALIVPGFASGGFLGAAHRAGFGWPASLLLALACAALLWVVVLAAVAVIVAAIPQAPLTLVTALATVVAVVAFHPGQSVLGERVLALPAGWVVRVFAEATERGTADWRLLGMSGLLAVLGWLNISQLRARFQVPEFAWRRAPAEAVMEFLVREEAGALAQSTANGAVVPEAGELLRTRAARNVEVSIRQAVAQGAWREAPRPLGALERLLWRLLPADHRSLAPFIAPMGREVTQGYERALIVCFLAMLGASLGAPLVVQTLALVAVCVLCIGTGRAKPLSPCILQGTLPIDPANLLWIALEIATLRVALWLPLLLAQAAAVEGGGAYPGAVSAALRLAVLLLAVQPLVPVMQVGAVDADATVDGRGLGVRGTLLALPVLPLASVAILVILAEPPFAEATLVALAGAFSLATFVLYGLRLGCAEASR